MAPCVIRGGVVNVMVIDSRAVRRREVQRKANLSYDCHCNRIFSPDSSIRPTVARYAPYSDYDAHLSITKTGDGGRTCAPTRPPRLRSENTRHRFSITTIFRIAAPRSLPAQFLSSSLDDLLTCWRWRQAFGVITPSRRG